MISYVIAIILGYWILERTRKAGAMDEKHRIVEHLRRLGHGPSDEERARWNPQELNTVQETLFYLADTLEDE